MLEDVSNLAFALLLSSLNKRSSVSTLFFNETGILRINHELPKSSLTIFPSPWVVNHQVSALRKPFSEPTVGR